jgi:hypothetical protein
MQQAAMGSARTIRSDTAGAMTHGAPSRTGAGSSGVVGLISGAGRWWLRHWLRYAEAVGAQWR